MPHFSELVVYFFMFLSLFYQVFLLITYFEKKDQFAKVHDRPELSEYPTVAILVPVWNEEKTVCGTVDSLLGLDYPKDKLKIMVINDGSTDGTAEVLKRYEGEPRVEVIHKENGGKHTALNYGLAHSKSEFVGCLDADSFVDPQALKHIIPHFADSEVMAVVPSIKVHDPKTVIQHIQGVEYSWGILVRKILSLLDALYVTPGPFSIFRRSVFEKLGPYRHAHNTEDMELALRMQENRYKMVNSHYADVYTVAPRSLKKLYKQRLRWSSGFLNNALDYKHLYFRKKYGNLGLFILPMATITIFSAVFFTATALLAVCQSLIKKIVEIDTVGFRWDMPGNLDWFYFNTQLMALVGITLFLMSLSLVLLGRKLADGKMKIGLDLAYFLVLYSFIAPLWLAKAVYNFAFARTTSWR